MGNTSDEKYVINGNLTVIIKRFASSSNVERNSLSTEKK